MVSFIFFRIKFVCFHIFELLYFRKISGCVLQFPSVVYCTLKIDHTCKFFLLDININ